MNTTAQIVLKNDEIEICLEWLGFDGDDCFKDFHITVKTNNQSRRFDFGECVIWGLRKPVHFLVISHKTRSEEVLGIQISAIMISIV